MTNQTIISKTHRGYYSLVQFCPDLARLEVANIGVVLVCDERVYLGVRMSSDHSRITQMFGRGKQDLAQLKAVKAGLKDRILAGRKDLQSLDELNRFAALRVNGLQMTKFMPCKVSEQPKHDLDRLFEDLVERTTSQPASKLSLLTEKLERGFSSPDIHPLIQRDITVTVETFAREEEIPFAFQNGRLNLIEPVVFPKTKSKLEERTAMQALVGKSLYEHRDRQFGDLQLMVFGQFPTDNSEDRSLVRNVLEKNHVRLFSQDQLPDLLDEVRNYGHL